jgi:hypothetical protein
MKLKIIEFDKSPPKKNSNVKNKDQKQLRGKITSIDLKVKLKKIRYLQKNQNKNLKSK